MHITIVEPLDGTALRKHKLLCADGSIMTVPEDKMLRGRASVWPVPMAGVLAQILDGMTQQAITLGVPRAGDGPWWVVTKAALREIVPARMDVIARTLDCFGWPDGAGWLLVDMDRWVPKPLEILQYLWPEIAEASVVIRGSSGAGIRPETGGVHIFVLVAEVARAREMLQELARRAASIGHEGLIDVMVGSPERLVYVAPPILSGGLTRSVPPTYWREGCAIGMAGICAPERPQTGATLPVVAGALGALSDPAQWPADLHEAVEGYLLSVVHGLCADQRATPHGKRSQHLYAAGARLGNYAWTGSRALRGAGDMLMQAAADSGYMKDYRPEVAQAHLARGWAHGMQKPEGGLPPLARWSRKDEIVAMGAALVAAMKGRS